MKRIACAATIVCALVLGGCAGIGGGSSRPATAQANLDMYDQPAPTHKAPQSRKSRPQVSRQTEVEAVASPETVGSASMPAAAPSPQEYSPEWWAQERAREKRDAERLKAVSQICRGC